MLKWILMNLPCTAERIEGFFELSEQHKTYKSGGVVIPRSLGVAESFQDWIGLNDLILQRDFAGIFLLGLPGPHHGKVGDDLLCVLRLPGPGLSPRFDI